MSYFRLFLWPFAWLYGLCMRFRNLLYDKKIYSIYHTCIPSIGIGNLTVGGTGKTPLVAYLIEKLAREHHLYVVSRGYKRQSIGMIWCDKNTHVTPTLIGDEPYMLYKKFSHHNIHWIIHHDRAQALQKIACEAPPQKKKLILLDDVYQHRRIAIQHHILLTDYARLFTKDFMLPYGRLREPRKGAHRAQMILVTKCPEDMPLHVAEKIQKKISAYCKKPFPPIFFAKINYQKPQTLTPHAVWRKNVLLITGIAQPDPLVMYCKKNFTLLGHLAFADHHWFSKRDFIEIQQHFLKNRCAKKCILTTEKDSVRILHHPLFQSMLGHLPIFFLPIKMTLLFEQALFDHTIQQMTHQ